jgi:hypothetical protein
MRTSSNESPEDIEAVFNLWRVDLKHSRWIRATPDGKLSPCGLIDTAVVVKLDPDFKESRRKKHLGSPLKRTCIGCAQGPV